MSDKHKAYYIKTENGEVHFEVPDGQYTFDVPQEHKIEGGGTFIIDDLCECYMAPMEDDEKVFIARKGAIVLAIGIKMDEDFNGEIIYATILTVKEPKH